MNQYRQQALEDILNNHAEFMFKPYDTPEALDQAIESGDYTGKIYVNDWEGKARVVATLRLEPGEGKYCLFEGSTWMVAYWDILNRWYSENKNYFDQATNQTLD